MSEKVAAVLVRGKVGLQQEVKDTLSALRLQHKNTCVVLEKNPAVVGMLKKVKDFIAWGEVSEETISALVEKRGEAWLGRMTDRKEKYSYKTFVFNGKHYKPEFHLNPPRKGFGRKGIKIAFTAGGALGYRGDKMNDLVMRML